MSFSFQPITGKRTFGTVGKTLESVGHIETIKLKNLRCTPERICDYRANRFKGGWESSKYTFYSRHRNKGSEFDSTQLYNGLYSVVDFNKSRPHIIKNNSTGESPTKMLPKGAVCQPYYQQYTIDPNGDLFGNNACGIHNYMNYVKPALQTKIANPPKTQCEIIPPIQDTCGVVDECVDVVDECVDVVDECIDVVDECVDVVDECVVVRLECSADRGADYVRIFNIIAIAYPDISLKQLYTYCDSIMLKFLCLEDIVSIEIIENYDANCNNEKPENTTCDVVVVEEPTCGMVVVEENPCDVVVVEEPSCDVVVVEEPSCDVVVVEEAVSVYDKLYDYLQKKFPTSTHKQILKLCNAEVRKGTVPFDPHSKRR